MKSLYFIGGFLISLVSAVIRDDSAFSALNDFALKFLEETSRDLPADANIAISPYTIWTAMAIVNEGARSNTARELEKTLGIPPVGLDREQFRRYQKFIIQNIAQKQPGVSLEVLNSVFTRLDAKLNTTFKQLVQQVYNVEVESLNFADVSGTTRYINNKLYEFTKGRIPQIVNEEAVRNAEMFITSALFFKGLWDKKFEKENTRVQPFYNERKEVIATVPMMRNNGTFPFAARILNGQANAVELPYKGDRMSMIAIIPREEVSLSHVLRTLAATPFSKVLGHLKQSKDTYNLEEVRIALPKFKISTDLTLNSVLQSMGILDAFNERYADLRNMSPKSLYVSRVIHKAQIEVDEDGTVGTAVTAVEITNRIPSPYVVFNRPFAYIIFDKVTQTVVFAGRFSNPRSP